MKSTIELKGLTLKPSLGTYGPGDVVPDVHVLDLSLTIDPDLVLIEADGMEHIFDYDPLILEIDRLATEMHYETQERLMTRIVHACAMYAQIAAVDVTLRKRPVLNDSGELGVDAEKMQEIRAKKRSRR